MPRNRFVFTAPIVLAIVIIGVFAIRSRGDNNANVETTSPRNCPPVARADAAATKPATPVAIDVLANDTDPDGDPLVFQIRNTVGGDATIADGGTPTDAADDRVLFTPADPPAGDGKVDYQALDPDGASSDATVTVAINTEGVLPAGLASEPVPAADKIDDSGRCNKTTSTTEGDSTDTTRTTGLTTDSTTNPVIEGDFGPAPRDRSTRTNGRTTTTRRGSSTATTKATSPNQPDTPETTAKPQPPPTQPPSTQPPGPPPTTPPECGEPQNTPEYRQCVREHSGG